jgi:prepilin-type N-terminal cleavage/methylation domain-containing protein
MKGFTLVETLVAILILAIAALALAPLFVTGMQTNASAFDYTMANTLAKEKIEAVTLLPSGDLSIQIPSGQTSLTITENITKFYFQDKSQSLAVASPYTRVTTIQEFLLSDMVHPLTASATTVYDVKQVTVRVTSARGDLTGGLRGLRGITETAYIRNTFSFSGTPGW